MLTAIEQVAGASMLSEADHYALEEDDIIEATIDIFEGNKIEEGEYNGDE